MEHENDGDTNCNWSAQYRHQRVGTGTEGLGNKRTSGDYTNYSIVENYREEPWRLEKTFSYSDSNENYRLTLV